MYSSDGSTIASGSWDGTVCLWDSHTGELLQTLRGHTRNVASVAFSPDSGMIACGNDDTIHLWDVQTGTRLHSLTGHTDLVDSLMFLPDGKSLVSGSRDGSILLWDLVKLVPDR